MSVVALRMQKRIITMLQTTFQNIEESLKQLPYSLQVEVFHYIEFLKRGATFL